MKECPVLLKIKNELMKSVPVVVSKVGISGPPGTGKTRLRALLLGKLCPKPNSTDVSTTADEILDNDFANWILSKEKKKSRCFTWKVADRDKWASMLANIILSKGVLTQSDIRVLTDTYSGGKCRKLGLLGMILTKLKKKDDKRSTKSMPLLRLIYLVDNGGQPQFQELLPKFLYSTINLLVHNLEQNFDDQPEFHYEVDEIPYRGEDSVKASNISIIQQTVRSICSVSRASEINDFPQLAFVGTFKDKVEDDLESILKKKSTTIIEELEKFTSSPRQCDFITYARKEKKMIFFPIDGSQAGWDQNDEVIDKLKTEIQKGGVEQKMPLWHIVLLQDIKKMQEKIIKVENCCKILENYSFQLQRDDVIKALQEFHKLNVIVYFSHLFPDLVFTDPSFLYKLVSKVVTLSFQNNRSREPFLRKCKKFNCTGVLRYKFLNDNIKELNQSCKLFTKEIFLQLLEELLIIADLGDQEYFMPCVLPLTQDPSYISEITQIRYKMDENHIDGPLTVTFGDHISPCGLFCSLIVQLIQNSSWTLRKENNMIRKRNIVDFSFSKDNNHHKSSTLIGKVIILDKSTSMEVYTDCPSAYCKEIKTAVEFSIDRACKTMRYLPDAINIQFGFKCSHCRGKEPLHHTTCSLSDGRTVENCSYKVKHHPLTCNREVWFGKQIAHCNLYVSIA